MSETDVHRAITAAYRELRATIQPERRAALHERIYRQSGHRT